MARGRPRKPTKLHVAEGTIIPCRHADRALEPQPGPLGGMPEGLSGGAAEWWQRTVPMLDRLGVVTEADRDSLIVAAEIWSALQDTMVAVQIDSLDKNMRCAFVQLQDAYAKWAGKFGLTPADRAKIQVHPKAKETDKESRFFG